MDLLFIPTVFVNAFSPLVVLIAVASSLHGAELPYEHGSTTLAVLPDTQYYSQKYPRHFEAQTRWIADHAQTRSIAYVLHVGDIVQSNSSEEWQVATRCFAMLDGKVPYLLTPGNHDYSDGTRDSRLSEYFPVSQMQTWPTFAEVFEKGKLDNAVHLFRIGKQDWMALGLEYGPRAEVMDWANAMLLKYRDRRTIIVTHGYLFYNNTRYDHRQGEQRASPHGYAGDGADGQALWNRVVRRHPNVMMVVCGHVRTGGLGYRASEGDFGNTVHEMMANYQKLKGGGMAYMRLLEFLPDGKTIQVRTFSPLTGKVRNSPLEEFRFELRGPTRDEPRPVPSTPATPLHHPPVFQHRNAGPERHDLPPGIVDNLQDISVEIWVTPTAEQYNWNAPFTFGKGGKGDAFYYTFRTRTTHRAELIRAGHNERIQRSVPVKTGQVMQVVVTYDRDGADGNARLSYYRDGVRFGEMTTDISLRDLDLRDGRLGPFAGKITVFRIYAQPLTPGEVAGLFLAGPDATEPEPAGNQAPYQLPYDGAEE